MNGGGKMCRVVGSVVAGLVLLTVLTGCGGVYVGDNPPGVSATPKVKPSVVTRAGTADDVTSVPVTFYVTLANKNQVLCVGVNDRFNGGPTTFSCDWSNAQGLNKNYVG